MALPTSSTTAPVMQAAPSMASPPPEPPTPVLLDDIQPIYLARLYPEHVAGGMSDARNAALEAGNSARDQGMQLRASQQEPLPALTEPEPPPPPPSGGSGTDSTAGSTSSL